MSWFGDAVDFVGDVASDVGGAVVDTVSDVGSGIADVAVAGYEGACDVGNAISGGVKWAEEGISGGLHSAEDWVNEESHALAGMVSDVPILGTLAEGAADYVSMGTEVWGGILGGATSLVGGVVNAVAHPIDTVKGLEALAEHMPGPAGMMLRAGHNAIDVISGKESVGDALNNTFNPLATMEEDAKFWGNMGSAIIDPYKKSAEEGRYGEVAGRAIFDVGSLLIGAGEANAGVKGAELAADATRAGELAGDVGRAGEIAADAGRAGEAAADAGRAGEAAADAGRTGEAAGDAGRLHSGPSGANYVDKASPEAIKAYQEIAAAEGDTAEIAAKMGVDEDVVRQVKQHLFENEYDLPVVNEAEKSVAVKRGQFVPDEGIAQQWKRAQAGFPPGSPAEAEFRRFLAHEYIEKGLMTEGMPYKAVESFGEGRYGYYNYPTAEFHGAHDLAPATNAMAAPFAGWKEIFGDSVVPPSLKPDLSNLNEVLEQIKHMKGLGKK